MWALFLDSVRAALPLWASSRTAVASASRSPRLQVLRFPLPLAVTSWKSAYYFKERTWGGLGGGVRVWIPPLLSPGQPCSRVSPIPSGTSYPGIFKPNNSSLTIGSLILSSTLKC